MNMLKKLLGCFHNIQSFKKCGLKQLSTWVGILIFICVFNDDILILVHNVLTDANLAEKIATGLGGFVLIMFNKKGRK